MSQLVIFLLLSLLIGDPYKDAGKLKMRQGKKDGHKEAGHDHNFKPAKAVKAKIGADFEH